MTSVLNNVYINKLNAVVNKYNHIYYSTSNMRTVDVKSTTFINFDKKNNKEDPKFKVEDHIRT